MQKNLRGKQVVWIFCAGSKLERVSRLATAAITAVWFGMDEITTFFYHTRRRFMATIKNFGT